MTEVTEARLLSLWESILGVRDFSVDDNFFDVGGTSAFVLILRERVVEEFKVNLPLTDFFRYPTVRALAARVAGSHGADASDGRGVMPERDVLRRRRQYLETRARR
jgi:acyl carrier protein